MIPYCYGTNFSQTLWLKVATILFLLFYSKFCSLDRAWQEPLICMSVGVAFLGLGVPSQVASPPWLENWLWVVA